VVERKTSIEAYALTLDAMIFTHAQCVPGFVKIDVEGAEAHVLRGMKKTLQQYRPHLLIEMHACYYGHAVADEVTALVKQAQYQWVAVREHGRPHWYLHAQPV
jgi:hypothetical protein